MIFFVETKKKNQKCATKTMNFSLTSITGSTGVCWRGKSLAFANNAAKYVIPVIVNYDAVDQKVLTTHSVLPLNKICRTDYSQ